MRFVVTAAVLIVAVCALEGCGSQMRGFHSAALVSGKVRMGMARGDVVGLLGKAQSTEMVGTTEFLFYTPSWYISPLFVTSQTPVAIRDGKVVGIGKSYYDETVQSISTAKISK